MRGLDVVRVFLFFCFEYFGEVYPCAFVRWFSRIGNERDENTGMWMVQPELDTNGEAVFSVIHLDCIVRAAHLLPIFGNDPIPKDLLFHHTLDAFSAFYVNRYGDHHYFEVAS
jgi:hypothetical protein